MNAKKCRIAIVTISTGRSLTMQQAQPLLSLCIAAQSGSVTAPIAITRIDRQTGAHRIQIDVTRHKTGQ